MLVQNRTLQTVGLWWNHYKIFKKWNGIRIRILQKTTKNTLFKKHRVVMTYQFWSHSIISNIASTPPTTDSRSQPHPHMCIAIRRDLIEETILPKAKRPPKKHIGTQDFVAEMILVAIQVAPTRMKRMTHWMKIHDPGDDFGVDFGDSFSFTKWICFTRRCYFTLDFVWLSSQTFATLKYFLFSNWNFFTET